MLKDSPINVHCQGTMEWKEAEKATQGLGIKQAKNNGSETREERVSGRKLLQVLSEIEVK